jgi:Asp-tRNA(Asn)/Glu-tRNA(Gln) amidotransferase A subunit family amidase
VLLTPSAQGEAPFGLHYTGDHRFQSIWTQLRTPAITLPTHAGPNGMPVGIQLVAPCYADDRLLAMAQLIFHALGRGPAIQVRRRLTLPGILEHFGQIFRSSRTLANSNSKRR